MINWTALSAIATVSMTAVTLYYVILTRRILRTNQQILDESTRPYIILSVVSEDAKVQVRIENFAQRAALQFTGTFDPPLDEKLFHRQIGTEPLMSMLKQGYIAPGQRISTMVGLTKDIVNGTNFESIQRKHDVHIRYFRDLHEKPIDESYKIDLADILIPKKLRPESSNFKLGQIVKYLHLLNESIKKLAKS